MAQLFETIMQQVLFHSCVGRLLQIFPLTTVIASEWDMRHLGMFREHASYTFDSSLQITDFLLVEVDFQKAMLRSARFSCPVFRG